MSNKKERLAKIEIYKGLAKLDILLEDKGWKNGIHYNFTNIAFVKDVTEEFSNNPLDEFYYAINAEVEDSDLESIRLVFTADDYYTLTGQFKYLIKIKGQKETDLAPNLDFLIKEGKTRLV